MSVAPKIVFAGTPVFAVPSLRSLLSKGVEVPVVLTQPDRPAGRGRRLTQSSVKQEALAQGLVVCQPSSLESGALGDHGGLKPDLLVVVAYGLLLPTWVLEWPRLGAINVHASLLPRWRGAAPIQHAVMAGDAETGVSIMEIDAGLDTGPVYGQRSAAIEPAESAGELHDRLAKLGAELLGNLLPGILCGDLSPVPQEQSKVTYAPKIEKQDAPLDWTLGAVELERRIRAFNPWPVAETMTMDGRRVRIWEAIALKGACSKSVGSVIAATKHGIDVATGEGALRILRLQSPGKKAMAAEEYVNAYRLQGTQFVC